MNAQEILNKVVTHAAKQNAKALRGDRCSYRSDSGQCFVGALIPNELYDIDMEDLRVKAVIDQFPKLKSVILPSNLKEDPARQFLEDLQHIHDRHDVTRWQVSLTNFAMKYQLKMPSFIIPT